MNALDFTQLFKNTQPVEIEIGCGKGKFLLGRAEESPGLNFLGLDRVAKWMNIGKKKSGKLGLANLVFLQAEIREFLAQIPEQSIQAFHIYFPDPWPKRRHRKRRLIQPDFLEALEKKLMSGGVIEMATDDADYFEHIERAASDTGFLWNRIQKEDKRTHFPHLKTNYELKYETAGRRLCYLELVKK